MDNPEVSPRGTVPQPTARDDAYLCRKEACDRAVGDFERLLEKIVLSIDECVLLFFHTTRRLILRRCTDDLAHAQNMLTDSWFPALGTAEFRQACDVVRQSTDQLVADFNVRIASCECGHI